VLAIGFSDGFLGEHFDRLDVPGAPLLADIHETPFELRISAAVSPNLPTQERSCQGRGSDAFTVDEYQDVNPLQDARLLG
jgi:hypothetical protein